MRPKQLAGGLMVTAVLVGLAWLFWPAALQPGADEQREQQRLRKSAQAQCERWAERLEAQTTDTGVYIRWQGEDLPEADPWGRPLKVHYSQGGLAESFIVRSAGPDGVPHTEDDVAAARSVVNFKGVGQGVKKNVEETAANATRGLVRGAAEEVKGQVKGLFRGKAKE